MPYRKVIVLVDDERSYTQLLSDLLTESLDCTVCAFTSGADALAALPTLEVGLIVTDYSMPRMTGLEFVHHVRKLLPDTPCLVITGHTVGLPEAEFAAIPTVKSVLYKPLRWRQLAEEIRQFWPDHADRPAWRPATSLI